MISGIILTNLYMTIYFNICIIYIYIVGNITIKLGQWPFCGDLLCFLFTNQGTWTISKKPLRTEWSIFTKVSSTVLAVSMLNRLTGLTGQSCRACRAKKMAIWHHFTSSYIIIESSIGVDGSWFLTQLSFYVRLSMGESEHMLSYLPQFIARSWC